ncbi:MAG: hypothetical protein A3J83_03855 [Elusimicrobia bacterium RIFOXYA2_FULL_40_6]|nr:MAG: hypothetical protein A3J83_03855 [Elusimicrobia bacterium RIFOXYA2_FULL_40_6]
MNAIEIKNLSKKFHKEQIRGSFIKKITSGTAKSDKYFYALKNINFELEKGKMLGIIGPNGSGKTTLLKTISGIYAPTEGELKVNGSINFFLMLGIGFQSELTARENISLYGALLGLSNKFVAGKINEIIAFAGVEQFIDTKLKHYSAGMQNRLAFSTAIQAGSDILLLDEIFAVGDLEFQNKCTVVLRRFKQEGRTIVLISHSLETIEEFCDYSLYLDKGEQIDFGETKSVIQKYKDAVKK